MRSTATIAATVKCNHFTPNQGDAADSSEIGFGVYNVDHHRITTKRGIDEITSTDVKYTSSRSVGARCSAQCWTTTWVSAVTSLWHIINYAKGMFCRRCRRRRSSWMITSWTKLNRTKWTRKRPKHILVSRLLKKKSEEEERRASNFVFSFKFMPFGFVGFGNYIFMCIRTMLLYSACVCCMWWIVRTINLVI